MVVVVVVVIPGYKRLCFFLTLTVADFVMTEQKTRTPRVARALPAVYYRTDDIGCPGEYTSD